MKIYLFLFVVVVVNESLGETKLIEKKFDLSKWTTNNKCEKFKKDNHIWTANCNEKPMKFCKLTTDLIELEGVNEINVQLKLNVSKQSGDLIVYYKRKTKENMLLNEFFNRIALDRTAAKENVIWSQNWQIDVQGYKGLSFEFHDYYNFCGTLNNISLFYNECTTNKVASGFANYGNFKAPRNGEVLIINGTCNRGAIKTTETLYAECLPSGESKRFGTCTCPPGYHTEDSFNCLLCPRRFYKLSSSEESNCIKCGKNSLSAKNRQSCKCVSGYFRRTGDEKEFDQPCYTTKVKNLKFSNINEKSVTVEWTYDDFDLGVGNVTFVIECENCKTNEGTFPIKTTKYFAKINGLAHNKIYSISVVSTFKFGTEDLYAVKVHGGFKTADQASMMDMVIIIVSVVTPVVLISICLVVCLYLKHQRNTTHFLQRINSLKRLRRPPPPPSRADSTASEINPYAYFTLPFKIPELKSDEESVEEDQSKSIERYSTLTFQKPYKPSNENQKNISIVQHHSMKDFHRPSPLNTKKFKSPHKHLDEMNDSDGYISMNANITNNNIHNPQKPPEVYDYPKAKPRSKTFSDLKTNRSVKCKSFCESADPFGLGLSVHDINKAKMNNKYKRNQSKDVINKAYDVPQTPHSADDINKLYDIIIN